MAKSLWTTNHASLPQTVAKQSDAKLSFYEENLQTRVLSVVKASKNLHGLINVSYKDYKKHY